MITIKVTEVVDGIRGYKFVRTNDMSYILPPGKGVPRIGEEYEIHYDWKESKKSGKKSCYISEINPVREVAATDEEPEFVDTDTKEGITIVTHNGPNKKFENKDLEIRKLNAMNNATILSRIWANYEGYRLQQMTSIESKSLLSVDEFMNCVRAERDKNFGEILKKLG